ncbi:MAG: aminotransferase class I/II-fold pyridoxal phosphate-dependent enzyme [Bacteroidota bacterium]
MATTRTKQHLETVEKNITTAVNEGIIHLNAEEEISNGRTVTVQGQELLNFGLCSYLGLEFDQRIKEGVIDAVTRYGSQFSTSRAYLSVRLYQELETELEMMFRRPVVVAASTTHGHLSAIPVLVGENDVVILDHQVHASVQMAVQLVKQKGTKVEMIRHSNMEMLEERIKKLEKKYDKIWYLADGIYSMFGDYAPMDDLTHLLVKYESFHLYIDDAHGGSCMGPKGTGYVNRELPYHPRLYLAISFAKSFAAGGGVIVFPNHEEKDRVRKCGNTLIFSGPVQPPMLGAALASIKLHQTRDLPILQDNLARRVAYFNHYAKERDIPLFSESTTPICFINVGMPEVGFNMVKRLKAMGFFTNLAVYPSVPYKNTGIRLTITNHLQMEDIKGVLDAIEMELPKALAEENSSMEDVYHAFKVTQVH